MAVQTTLLYMLVDLCSSLSTAAPVSENLVVSVQSSVSVHINNTTTLPCWITPPQNAEDLEVRWYRGDDKDAPILLYRKRMLDASYQDKYEGRVSFVPKDAASAGLKDGDVSLRLVNVSIEDEGDYTCYISSEQGYDKGIIRLSVIETGTSPLISEEWIEDNVVNVSCESTGWYPKPQLRWSDQNKNLNPKRLIYRKSSSGLVSVHSWVLVSSSSEVSCSVVPSDGETKVARVQLGNPPPHKVSGSSVAGWVAFALLLISVVAVVGVMYFKKRALFCGKKDESQNDPADGKDVTEPLLKNVSTEFTEATQHYVNVTLEHVENPYLKTVRGCLLRDNIDNCPDGSNVTRLTAIRGTPGFSSGKHYWEVKLSHEPTGVKQSWWLGVTSSTTKLHEHPESFPTMSNGFWFLSSSTDGFQFNTEPSVFLPVLSRPQTVGVYLNYDGGELSFYNVEAKSLIGSLNVRFTGEVFPLFNPGKGDKPHMEIIHKTQQSEDGNKENSVEPTQEE